jgi:hypothetical protein
VLIIPDSISFTEPLKDNLTGLEENPPAGKLGTRYARAVLDTYTDVLIDRVQASFAVSSAPVCQHEFLARTALSMSKPVYTMPLQFTPLCVDLDASVGQRYLATHTDGELSILFSRRAMKIEAYISPAGKVFTMRKSYLRELQPQFVVIRKVAPYFATFFHKDNFVMEIEDTQAFGERSARKFYKELNEEKFIFKLI